MNICDVSNRNRQIIVQFVQNSILQIGTWMWTIYQIYLPFEIISIEIKFFCVNVETFEDNKIQMEKNGPHLLCGNLSSLPALLRLLNDSKPRWLDFINARLVSRRFWSNPYKSDPK